MQRYIKEGRLLVDPFYVRSDWTLTGGAKQIHNFLLTRRHTSKSNKIP